MRLLAKVSDPSKEESDELAKLIKKYPQEAKSLEVSKGMRMNYGAEQARIKALMERPHTLNE